LSTPWDISTASYSSKRKDVSVQTGSSNKGISFSPDGVTLFICAQTTTIYQYTLSTAWDISTASYASKSKNVSAQVTDPYGLYVSTDGLTMFVSTVGSAKSIYQYTLSTAWDVSTASYASKSKSVSAEISYVGNIFFKPDGSKMFASVKDGDDIYQYTLSTPMDVSTASYDSKTYSISTQDLYNGGFYIKSDGLKMYVAGQGNARVYQYTLT